MPYETANRPGQVPCSLLCSSLWSRSDLPQRGRGVHKGYLAGVVQAQGMPLFFCLWHLSQASMTKSTYSPHSPQGKAVSERMKGH